ncbi:endo alpha-1,4 polygalactosaminidase [Plantactinospora siamensis]|uniref:Endo alpha-1,4 polygalactosaminidase n=1 Tax=Plantactinospora siamensis TaxID=555372 RepID=A0ABV6P655_9ACTN
MPGRPAFTQVRDWAYQLQAYAGDGVSELVGSAHQLVVIDLARDAGSDWFTAAETGRLRAAGKWALAYFEIGSIEEYRPEYPVLRDRYPGLILNRWPSWPQEHFVRYWDERWWDLVVRPRVDQAIRAGFDGVYLDTPLAYEEIDLALVPRATRDSLAWLMVGLIGRLSRYAKEHKPGMLVVPQNSPELRRWPGYTSSIDGIGIEELYYRATDLPCTADWCATNLANVRALRAAGKAVLAVDYATNPAHIRHACDRYRAEGFAGYVTTVDLDRLSGSCPSGG